MCNTDGEFVVTVKFHRFFSFDLKIIKNYLKSQKFTDPMHHMLNFASALESKEGGR